MSEDITSTTDRIGLDEFWYAVEAITCTRSTNAKQDVVEYILREWPHEDATIALAYFTNNQFPDGEKDYGTHHLKEAYAGTHEDSIESVEERAKEVGDPSLLWPRQVDARDGSGFRDLKLVSAHERVETAWEMSGDNPTTRFLGSKIEKCSTPRALAWMFVTDIALGMGSAIIRDAMAEVYGVSRHEIDRSYGSCRNVVQMFQEFEDGYEPLHVTPTRRFQSMKAPNTEIPDDTSDMIAEVKYDGARIHIHRHESGQVEAFTGGGLDITAALPELQDVEWPDEAFVVDGEVVAYDPTQPGELTDSPLPFQNVMKRITRKNNVLGASKDVEVRFHLFDIVYWMDGSLIDEPYSSRHGVLVSEFPESVLAHMDTDVDACYKWAMEHDHEGIIVKELDSPYKFTRDSSWIKKKPEPETLDLQVTEVELADGEMAGMMGALRVETADGEDLGWVGTGYSDAQRKEIAKNPDDVIGSLIQVKFEELQPASNGYGLRFPAFDGFRPEGECDSMDRVFNISEVEP